MRYAALALFSSSLGFLVLVLGHFRAQRKKQEELERKAFKAAARRAEL
jgi:hypothetical protein